MWLALLLVASLADWVPARWNSPDPKSLELVAETPVNCLLVEAANWSPGLREEAERRGIVLLGVIHPQDDWRELMGRLSGMRFAGAVLEGIFEPNLSRTIRASLKDSRLVAVELGARTHMRLEGDEPVMGTFQGLWPGINAAEDGSAKAAPSGAPWIDTNTGFLRFVRSLTRATVWIGNRPPANAVVTVPRYFQAIGDAAQVGARWVVALEPAFEKKLVAGDEPARRAWRRIGEHLRFYEEQKQWRDLAAWGKLAIVQDVASGGLISGGILDMISVKHTPVRSVPGRLLNAQRMEGAQLAVNVDPEAMTEAQREVLRAFTRAGGTLLTAPPGWKFPPQRPDQIVLDKEDIHKLDQIWREVNSLTGRRNLGARLFNVSSMLSNLQGPAGGSPLVLQLVNYSDYAVENVTVHVLGKHKKAMLYEPASAPRAMPVYDNDEGTGIDLDKITSVATLVVE